MLCTDGAISGVKRLQLLVHSDKRGHFVESFQSPRYTGLLGTPFLPLQQNVSLSKKGVLRGLHFQQHQPQAKLVRVLQGKVLDVIVDLRLASSTYGKHVAYTLFGPEHVAEQPHEQLWLPAGVAHGFYVLSDEAMVEYTCDTVYEANDEHSLLWNDPHLAIQWPDAKPLLSEKDQQAKSLAELEQANLLPQLP